MEMALNHVASNPQQLSDNMMNVSLRDLNRAGNHRYKGYVNDFMVSPRNPITMHPEPTEIPNKEVSVSKPVQSLSAELKGRKAEADQEIAAFKQAKLKEKLESEIKRQQELESIKQYHPFGRPGAGAPIYQNHHNRRKLTEHDTYYLTQTNHSDYQTEPTLVHAMPDREIHFRAEHPEHSALDRVMAETQKRIDRLKQEIDYMNTIPYIDPVEGNVARPPPAKQGPFQFYDPWGKGQGNPRRKNNGSLEGYTQIREQGIVPPAKEMRSSWPNELSLSSVERSSAPAVSVPVPTQSYSPSWEPKGNNSNNRTIGTGLNTDSRYGGGGSVVKTDSGSQRTRFPITMRKDIHGNSNTTEMDGYNPFKVKAPENHSYFPFGKPGGGAPLRDEHGKLSLQRRNIDFAHELDTSADINKRRKAADIYLKELKKEMEEQRRYREESNIDARAPIGELATLVRQGKVGFPRRDPQTGMILDHHHKFSDVTKTQAGLSDSKKFAGVIGEDDVITNTNNAKKYHEDLSKIAEERYRMRQLERMRNQQEELQHGERWNEFWGRPGAGAPNSQDQDTTFKRHKIDEALYHQGNRNLVFVKNTPHGIQELYPVHYNKSTIQSNHSNMFELPTDFGKEKHKAGYKLTTPFATLLPN